MALFIKRKRRPPDINIVPLMDVLVVLIFFFLMTMQAKTPESLDITPPKMDTAGAEAPTPKRLVIGINKDGQYFVNNQPVSIEALDAALGNIASTSGTNTVIILLADEDTPLKNVTHVMDESRKLDLNNIRLQAR